MNEHELRDAFRGVLVASSPPPPMDPAAALEVARKAHRRRRAVFAGAGTVLAVVVITVAAMVAPGLAALRDSQLDPAGPRDTRSGPLQPPGTTGPGLSPPPPGGETETIWPTGPDGQPQSDRTASAGPRYDQGRRLLDELVAVVPPGYMVPPASAPNPTATVLPADYWARTHQAQFTDRVDGVEVWEYLASVSVSQVSQAPQGERTGRLLAQVHTPRNGLPSEPCELSQHLWGLTGECQLISVGDRQVGVVIRPTGGETQFDQWAAYRHPDGTVVFIAQAKQVADTGGRAPLEVLPMSVQRLAELAADPRFHLE